MTTSLAVTGTCVVSAWISFCVFLCVTYQQLKSGQTAVRTLETTMAAKSRVDGLADIDISKLLENASKLVESLTKAGPGLASLGASILFVAIAAYSVPKAGSVAPAERPAPVQPAKPPSS